MDQDGLALAQMSKMKQRIDDRHIDDRNCSSVFEAHRFGDTMNSVSGTLNPISKTAIRMSYNTVARAETRASSSTDASHGSGALEAKHELILWHYPHCSRYIFEVGAHSHDLDLNTGVR